MRHYWEIPSRIRRSIFFHVPSKVPLRGPEKCRISVTSSISNFTKNYTYLFEQARQLNKIKPRALLDDNQVFIVVDPISGDNLYFSTLGAVGYEFGLAVYNRR